MSSKTSLLPKSFSQKHIFNLIYARAFKGQEEQKRSLKKGSKHKIAYYEAKWDFKVPKMHSWLVNKVNQKRGKQGPKRAKISPEGGQNIK